MLIYAFLFLIIAEDCWQVLRDARDVIQPDLKAFPSGTPVPADRIHSMVSKRVMVAVER